MKKSQLCSAILIALFVLVSNIIRFPKVTAPPPSRPDRFIADIYPNNNNTNIHLLNVSANITLNASDRYNEMGISFIGKYSLFNPDNLTNITIILPLSLCLDIDHATFGVSVNDTQVPFKVVRTPEENLTSTGINVDLIPEFLRFLQCSITLLTTNLTLVENNTYLVKYQFEGSIPDPLKYEIFYMIYSSETAKFWKGNATERVEFNVFGGNPQFSSTGTNGPNNGSWQFLDIVGGKKCIYEWISSQEGWIGIGVIFDESNYSFLTPLDLIILNAPVYIAIIIVIVLWVRRRKRKHLRNL